MHIKLLRPILIGTKVHSEGVVVPVEDLHGRELVAKSFAEEHGAPEAEVSDDVAHDAAGGEGAQGSGDQTEGLTSDNITKSQKPAKKKT